MLRCQDKATQAGMSSSSWLKPSHITSPYPLFSTTDSSNPSSHLRCPILRPTYTPGRLCSAAPFVFCSRHNFLHTFTLAALPHAPWRHTLSSRGIQPSPACKSRASAGSAGKSMSSSSSSSSNGGWGAETNVDSISSNAGNYNAHEAANSSSSSSSSCSEALVNSSSNSASPDKSADSNGTLNPGSDSLAKQDAPEPCAAWALVSLNSFSTISSQPEVEEDNVVFPPPGTLSVAEARAWSRAVPDAMLEDDGGLLGEVVATRGKGARRGKQGVDGSVQKASSSDNSQRQDGNDGESPRLKSKLQRMLEERQAARKAKKVKRARQKEQKRKQGASRTGSSKRQVRCEFTVLDGLGDEHRAQSVDRDFDGEEEHSEELGNLMPCRLNMKEREMMTQQQQAFGMRSPDEVPRRGDLVRFVLPAISPASAPAALAPALHANSAPSTQQPGAPGPGFSTTDALPGGDALQVSPSTATAATDASPGAPTQAATAEGTEPSRAQVTAAVATAADLTAAAAATGEAAAPTALEAVTLAPAPAVRDQYDWCSFPVSLPLLSLHPLFERASAYLRGHTFQDLVAWDMEPIPWEGGSGEKCKLSSVHDVLIIKDTSSLATAVAWLEEDLWPASAQAPAASTSSCRTQPPNGALHAHHVDNAQPQVTESSSALRASSELAVMQPESVACMQQVGAGDSDMESGLESGEVLQSTRTRQGQQGESQQGAEQGQGQQELQLRGQGMPNAEQALVGGSWSSTGIDPEGAVCVPPPIPGSAQDAVEIEHTENTGSACAGFSRDREGGSAESTMPGASGVSISISSSGEPGNTDGGSKSGHSSSGGVHGGNNYVGPSVSKVHVLNDSHSSIGVSSSSSTSSSGIRAGVDSSSNLGTRSRVDSINVGSSSSSRTWERRRGYKHLFDIDTEGYGRGVSGIGQGDWSGSQGTLGGDLGLNSQNVSGIEQVGQDDVGQDGGSMQVDSAGWGGGGGDGAGLGDSIAQQNDGRGGNQHTHMQLPLHRQQSNVQQLLQHDTPRPVLGMDIEWDPTLRAGEFSPMGLLQLAGPSRCLLLRIQAMQTSAHAEQKSFLEEAAPVVRLLTNPSIVVASMGWNTEEQRKMHGALSMTREDMPGFVDVQAVAKASRIQRVGLNALAVQLLGAPQGWIKGSRGVIMSKWSKELSNRQISYAATDAFMAADVYRQLRLLHHAQPPAHCAFCAQPLVGLTPSSQLTCPVPGCRRRKRVLIQMGIKGAGQQAPSFPSIHDYLEHMSHAHKEEVESNPSLEDVSEYTCMHCGGLQFRFHGGEAQNVTADA